MRRSVRGALLVGALALTGALTGCTQDPNSVAEQARQGDQKGYISGDGSLERISEAERGVPVDLRGTTLDGKDWSAADERGKVLVVNVWGSWCAPCVAEAADLQQAWAGFEAAGRPVAFMGIDYREDRARGAAFVENRGITYPSLTDPSGVSILSLQGKATATPSTLVLDTEGRIAARVSGPVRASTLTQLVEDVLGGSKAS